MKTLIYGNLKIDLDLDPRQEEILKQTLLEDVKAIHYAFSRQKEGDHPQYIG